MLNCQLVMILQTCLLNCVSFSYDNSFLEENKLFWGQIIFSFLPKFSSQNNFVIFFSTFAILVTQPCSQIENQVKTSHYIQPKDISSALMNYIISFFSIFQVEETFRAKLVSILKSWCMGLYQMMECCCCCKLLKVQSFRRVPTCTASHRGVPAEAVEAVAAAALPAIPT